MEPVHDWTGVPVPVEDWTQDQLVGVPVEDWTQDQLVGLPDEDWTQDQFVPFSPRHVMSVSGQPEMNLLPLFPYNIGSQQATNFHVDIGKYSSQQSDDGLESVKKAIDDELQKLLSILSVPAAVGENTSASCNAALYDADESSENHESSVDSMSDSELYIDTESNTEMSLDIGFSTPYAMNETNMVNSNKEMHHHNVDQENSLWKVEDWLASDHIDSVSSASFGKKSKSVSSPSVQCSVSQYVPCAKIPSKHDACVQASIRQSDPSSKNPSVCISKTPSVCNDNMSKQAQSECGQSNLNNGQAADDQSACVQCLCEELPAASGSHHSADTKVSQQSQQRQSAKSKSHLSHFFCGKRGKNRREKKSSKMTVASRAIAAARAQNWQVQNISERCSIFEYKEEILNRPSNHHASFSRQV